MADIEGRAFYSKKFQKAQYDPFLITIMPRGIENIYIIYTHHIERRPDSTQHIPFHAHLYYSDSRLALLVPLMWGLGGPFV